jgi:caffeoyl-CoA O-methyltransferase
MKATGVDPKISEYLAAHHSAEDALLEELRRETHERFGRLSRMQISAEQGVLLHLLAASVGARRALEIGTFTGYSALQVARALPADGQLIACDLSAEFTDVARRYWERAGVAQRIDLRIGPAVDTLRALPLEPSFDFAFIDADKSGYRTYYEEALRRLRPSGLLAIDNALWGGRVLAAADDDPDTRAIHALNDFIARDPRVDAVLLAVGDGLMLARRKG